ncbi:hypothetical protein BD626DRAFT_557357 [Schizophyllum amplum]|uniref:MYND-type domain-containing protein n=1 Tax=Schizophyllum amplum TaxID=97359 RepID=A0A550CH34_9AGAR|nr:hypothetical protein BD626DRAFT_557357 [Auriculariopsis ampla]
MQATSTAEIRILVARLKQLPEGASRARVAPICAKLGPLITSEATFKELTVDPLALPPDEWRASSPAVSRALSAIDDLQEVLDIERVWFNLITWISFLYPGGGYLAPASRHIERVLRITRSLMGWKTATLHLLAQTPQLYAYIMWMWLHLPDYVSGDENYRIANFIVWLQTLVEAMFIVTGDEFDLAAANAESIDSEPDIVYDLAAVREGLAAVNHKPRRVYRLAIRCAQKLADTVKETAVDTVTEKALENIDIHLSVIRSLVLDVLVVGNHARDVIRSMVRLVRTLHALDPKHEVAGRACALLGEIWETATDHRSMVWALKDGIFPLMVEICQTTPSEQWRSNIGGALINVATRTAHLPVIRALVAHRGRATLKQAAFIDEEDLSLIDKIVERRVTLFKGSFPKECGNPECERKDVPLRRCECKTVYYCSKACQKRHWSPHVVNCLIGVERGLKYFGGFEIIDDASYLSHPAATFLMMLARKQVCGLDLIEILEKDVFLVALDFGDMPVDSEVSYVDESSKYERWQQDPTIIVTAKLGPLPSLPEDSPGAPACITAWRCVLGTLEFYRLGLTEEDIQL